MRVLTECKPEENAACFLGVAPTGESLLELVALVRVGVSVCILAAWLCPGGDGDDETVETTTWVGDQRSTTQESDIRDEEIVDDTSAGEDKGDAHFLECACEADEFFVLFVEDGDEEKKEGEEDAGDRDENGESGEPGCGSELVVPPDECGRVTGSHGPTSHLDWKAATLAKQAIAMKSKKICVE